MTTMTKDEVKARLLQHEGWERDGDEIERRFVFSGFRAAMAFVDRVADLAEAANHHPDITIKHNRVKLTLSTHSEGGVTEKDFALAAQIDIAANL